jgi:hypothetical protein
MNVELFKPRLALILMQRFAKSALRLLGLG